MQDEVDEFTAQRRRMVKDVIKARGITDPHVLRAFETVPRERFVPSNLRHFAYRDQPLPIGAGQTISQPYIVAFMLEALLLNGGERVLEVGAGSGYAAAIAGQIAEEVFTIERIEELAALARQNLAAIDCTNVHVLCSDGTRGWPENAPYDAIFVSAGGPEAPEALLRQLKITGRLVIPVGKATDSQDLVRFTRTSKDEWSDEKLAAVRFVPLIGEQGWTAAETIDGLKARPKIFG